MRAYEEKKSNSKIVAFLNNDKEKIGKKIEGISIYEPRKELLVQLEYDYIMIASVYGKWQIEKQLHNLGIADEKICHVSEGINVLPDLKNLAEIFEEEEIEG